MIRPRNPELSARVHDYMRNWHVVAEHTIETERSVLVFGARDGEPVLLKVLKQVDGEWRAGEVLAAFGRSAVRVHEYAPGALLLERLSPAISLVSVVERSDNEATEILADVIARLNADAPIHGLPTVQQWGSAFDRYRESGRCHIDAELVARAQRVYDKLCESQSKTHVLHGDLHHENVLYDSSRGWLVIDPKGVVGEAEYELGAALRNPCEFPSPFLEERFGPRVDTLVRRLGVDRRRTVGWAFSQAVLAVIWAIDDGVPIAPNHVWLRLASALGPDVEV